MPAACRGPPIRSRNERVAAQLVPRSRYAAAVKDVVVLAALLLSFATLVTTHVVIAVRLVWRVKPRYRGLIALMVPPLAPVWAHGNRWRRLCWTWVGAVAVYALCLALAAI